MKQKISETRPLPKMTPEEWDKIRVSKSHAELLAMGCVVEREVDVPDTDPDLMAVLQLRDKSLKATLTATELSQHNQAEIRCKAKGLL